PKNPCFKGCEPLPRRNCRPAAPPEYLEPYPLPVSLWSTLSDSSVIWNAYTCKNYACLINRKRMQKGFDDCKDCFDLAGAEKNRWAGPPPIGGGLDFSIDEVVAVKKPGTIRTGLDIGGGVATFALEEVYAPLINSIGFRKVKWVVGLKLDRGPELREMYLSAFLKKSIKISW
ncbi:hypothetical protein U1Q18_011384, partial [Sarracenia purpurea var. burkii]